MQQEMQSEVEALKAEVRELRRMYNWMRLAETEIVRVLPGDTLVLHVNRPLADSERVALVKAFVVAMSANGHGDIPVIVLCGHEEVKLQIVRQ